MLSTTHTTRSFVFFTLALLALGGDEVAAFVVIKPATTSPSSLTTPLAAGGFGGGGGSATASRKSSKSNKKKKSPSSSSFGSSTKTNIPSFDVSASLLRLEKRYEELSQADAKRLFDAGDEDDDIWSSSNSNNKQDDRVTTEYVVTARPTTGNLDWVPVGQLLMARRLASYDHDEHDDHAINKPLMNAAISLYCRELAHMAALGSRVGFANVPRNQLQYAVEPTDSWHKHVYDTVIFQDKNKNKEITMTRAEAAQVLGFDHVNDLDRSSLKRAYRTLSMQYHPDRLLEASEQEQVEGAERYGRVKRAYEMLLTSSDSWYESLGGKERTDFIKIDTQLLSIGKANELLDFQQLLSAVVPLDPVLVQGFVARSMVR
mmetsp:Transcript_1325/g.1786  ORF Transcript_1325/g.1786 Transcript_1325/m.1786 type:complete len:374 (+) Transcript_1325:100-1221(+)